MAIDRSKLLFYSNDPIDKIIYLHTTSLVVPAFDFNDKVISHGLGFRPFVLGEYSQSSDFTTSNTIGSFDATVNINTSIGEANTTDYTVRTDNNSGSSITLYFRIYAFADENAEIDVDYNSDIPTNLFQFNTDYNFGKLYDSDTTSSVASGSTATISHNLGYEPQVRAWAINNSTSEASPMVLSDYTQNGSALRHANNNQIQFINESGLTQQFHYRIYYDA